MGPPTIFIAAIAAIAIHSVSGAGCQYEGRTYQQGQTWSRQCQFNCVCDDASTGHYTCTDMCPTYTNLPAGCRLVLPPGEPCCKKPECHFQTMQPGAGGQVINIGGGSGHSGSGSGNIQNCNDKLPNC